jgi:hypothetical protein
LRHKQYGKAVTLAFTLQQPRRLLAIFNNISDKEHEEDGQRALRRRKRRQANATNTNGSDINGDGLDDEKDDKDRLCLDNVVRGFTLEQLGQCLTYIKEWNTNSKLCVIANKLLACIFRVFPPEHIKQCPYAQPPHYPRISIHLTLVWLGYDE